MGELLIKPEKELVLKIRDLCGEYAEESIYLLVSMIRQDDIKSSDRINAIKIILEHALLGADPKILTLNQGKDIKIEIKGLSNKSKK